MPIARVGHVNLAYYVDGSGPPVLMIMGLGGVGSPGTELEFAL